MALPPQELDALRKITSPTVANAIETFKVRPRQEGFLSPEIRALFPELGPMVGYAVTALIRAEQAPEEGHRAGTFAWWDYVQTIPAPRVIVVHDLDDPRGQGAQWGEVQANIHRALGCVGVVTDGSVRDLGEVRALSVPHEIAPKIPEAVLKVEAAERRIIAACQAADFSAEKLKALYREACPGTY